MRLAIAAALLAGCGVESLFLELPDIGSSQAIIVAAEEPNEHGLRLIAGDREFPVEVPVADPVTLHLLAYEQSLEELGLLRGPVPEPSTSRYDCARVEPALVYVASGLPERLEWTESEMPEPIRSQLIESPELTCGPCRVFDQEDVSLPGTGWPKFAVTTESDVVVGLSTGALIRLQANGLIVELCFVPPRIRSGAWRESDQSLVIGLEDGRILRVLDSSSRDECWVSQLGLVEGMPTRIDLADEGPLIAYVLTDVDGEAQMWRVADGSADKLGQYTVDPQYVEPYERGFRGGVTWVGPEHVIFAGGDNSIYRWRDGTVGLERLDHGDIDYRIQSLTTLPSGAIAGVDPWGIAVDDQGSWQLTDDRPTWQQLTALLPYEDVVLIGGLGALEIFDPKTRTYCPRFTNELAQGAPQALVKLGAIDVIAVDLPPDEGSLPRVRRLYRRDVR